MNPEDEAYASKLIERMKLQNKMMNPEFNLENPDQSPGNVGDVLNRSITPDVSINSEAILSNVQQSSPPVPAQGAFSECPQCGTMHPPVLPGKICPNKKIEIKSAGIKDEDINKFLGSLKNVCVSQIESKGVKDGNKLFKHIIMELTKFMEGYRE